MGLVDRFLKRPKPDPETRRRWLLENGRITDGIILEGRTEPAEGFVFYLYTLNGVEFESSDVLTAAQLSDPVKYAPGAKVGVRYDPRNQGNSVVE